MRLQKTFFSGIFRIKKLPLIPDDEYLEKYYPQAYLTGLYLPDQITVPLSGEKPAHKNFRHSIGFRSVSLLTKN